MKSFKDYVVLKEVDGSGGSVAPKANVNWKQETHKVELSKGFIPPLKLRPVIKAFLNSGKIILQNDLKKPVYVPQKSLFLVGGNPRDFVTGKTAKDMDLATNATPQQIALILTAAGFKESGDMSGKQGEELHVPPKTQYEGENPNETRPANSDDKLTWFIKGRDESPERKAFVISAVVDGEEFEIATFRRDAKITDGAAQVDFVDDPREDASRRDFTMNAMYIELNKPDGENKTLYDPTGKGFTDANEGRVRTVGNARERFEEDPLRVFRALRFHCRYSGGKPLDSDIKAAIPHFQNLNERLRGINRMKEEFEKAMTHPDIDPRCYLSILKQTGLLKTLFPGVTFDDPQGVPVEFTDKKDKILAVAWLLQHNPIEKVNEVLSASRTIGSTAKQTGWQIQEKKAILFLLRLKEFSPDRIGEFLRAREGTGLSAEQIKDWVEMFKIKGTERQRRPWWAKHVNTFANHQRTANWDQAVQKGLHICPTCKGMGTNCATCRGTGQIPDEQRSNVLNSLEKEEFMKKLGK